MKPNLPVALVTALATSIGAAQTLAQIELTDPADAALAVAVSDAVDAATETIGACREAGGAQAECFCANAADIEQVRAALETALDVHPEWAGQALFVADMGDGRSLTIFLDTVARMTVPPDCS